MDWARPVREAPFASPATTRNSRSAVALPLWDWVLTPNAEDMKNGIASRRRSSQLRHLKAHVLHLYVQPTMYSEP